MEKNPFSVYDFLGYVFPGAITLMIIRLVYYLHIHELLLSLYSSDLFVESLLHDFSWDDSIFFVLSAYVLGHIIAYASSLTIEPYAVWRYGYPSKFMLRNNPEKNYFSLRKKDSCKKKTCIVIYKLLVAIFIIPITICDIILGRFLHLNTYYVKGLDNRLKRGIYRKIKCLYKVQGLGEMQKVGDIKNNHLDYHRVVYHYVYEKHEAHRSKMDNYVALYGFMRALSFIVVLMFWVSVLVVIYEYDNIYFFVDGTRYWFISITLLSFFFFMGFMKFYRRFTLESLMCLVTDSELR